MRQRSLLRRGLVEGSAEGNSSDAESVLASRGPDGRPSSESEIDFASRVLGREPSSEAEISSMVSETLEGPYRGAGPWAEYIFGPFVPEEGLGRVFSYVLRFCGRLNP